MLAFVLTSLAVSERDFGRDLLSTLTAMFNPLPPIALLPLALLWFGLGTGSLIFVLIAFGTVAACAEHVFGLHAVPQTLRMTGRNYGLTGLRYVLIDLVPAALPSILAGLKDRLGLRVAHADCRGTRVRRESRAAADWAGTSSRTATSFTPTGCSRGSPR